MTERTLLLVHGTWGHPEENWFPWLRTQAETAGWRVVAPRLPTPVGQDLPTWQRTFREQVGSLKCVDVAIGHSLGATFLLRELEATDCVVPLLVLVSGALTVHDTTFAHLVESFTERSFDWELIRKRVARAVVVYSKNDPYVPEEQSKLLLRHLRADFLAIDSGGHLNSAAGYDSFPQLMQLISE